MTSNWKNSVFSDGSARFVSNQEPKLGDRIWIAIRFWKDSPVDAVWVSLIINGEHDYKQAEIWKEDTLFVYYRYQVELKQPRLQYQFMLAAEGQIYYYSQSGLHTSSRDRNHDFVLLTDYHQPAWMTDTVFYQIFPERFCNGDASLTVKDGEYQVNGFDTIQIRDWNTPAGTYETCHCADFYGGDLIGIQKQIPYLKKLGVNAIYLNPIFQAPSVHKYDCIDYLHVDPHFGGDEALVALSKALHENDMRLILDISINHTGTAHKWFNRDGLYYDKSVGAYNNPDAPERAFYVIHPDGTYECWDNVSELPKLDFSSEELRDALYKGEGSVLKKWLKPPYSIDGWRFDVADVMANYNEQQLGKSVWPEIRNSIREENPEAYVLAEHWDDSVEYMQGDCWDAPMNYYGFGRLIRQFYGLPDPFVEMTDALSPYTCNISAEDFRIRVEGYLSRLPFPFWQNQFNLFDSHDVGRFCAYPGVTEREFRGAVLALFTMIGVPSVYYGDELSIDGRIGFFEGARYPMPWERAEEEGEIYQLHQQLIRLRRTSSALMQGSFCFLYAADDVIAFSRFDDSECFVTILSGSLQDQEIVLGLREFGYGDRDRVIREVTQVDVMYTIEDDGQMCIEVPAGSSYLLHIV